MTRADVCNHTPGAHQLASLSWQMSLVVGSSRPSIFRALQAAVRDPGKWSFDWSLSVAVR